MLWCWPKKDIGNTKGLIEKIIYILIGNKQDTSEPGESVAESPVWWWLSVDSVNGITQDFVMLIGALHLMLWLTCIYGGGQVHYVGSTTLSLAQKVQLVYSTCS